MTHAEVLDYMRRELENDDKFMSFNRIMTRIRSEFNYEDSNREMAIIHSNRATRPLWLEPSIPETDKLVRADLKDSADRSRLVEISLPLKRWRQRVKHSIKMITGYLLIEREDLLMNIRHKTSRQEVVAVLLQPAEELLMELEAVIEGIDNLVQDIDQAGYSLKNTVTVLQTLHFNRSLGRTGS